MIQPLAFVENQKAHNVHDTLTPEASASVLRAHVTEGLVLAEKHRLPRAVTAAILEHHADLVMDAFLQKARAAAAEQGQATSSVEVAPYRYTGRPPQSKESAILLLADEIEAAARALDDPSEERLAELVDALVNRALAADTLAGCDLSLRDLGRVRSAFKRALVGFHAPEQTADGRDVELMAVDPVESAHRKTSPRPG